jgi:hypothetical protein
MAAIFLLALAALQPELEQKQENPAPVIGAPVPAGRSPYDELGHYQ